jgi:hypothetical protein
MPVTSRDKLALNLGAETFRKRRRAVSSVGKRMLHLLFTPLLARTNIVGHAEPSINKVNCGRYSVNKKKAWLNLDVL